MPKPIYVFVDTNIAIHQAHFFFKKGGQELVSALRASGARVLLPDVLYREYLKNYVAIGRAARDELKADLSKFRAFFDGDLDQFLPADSDLEARATATLDSLRDIMIVIPETDALVVAAGRRSMADIAPCTKSDHGFKDCLIWDSILSMAAGGDLHIVTQDRAFFAGDKGNALAPSILAEGAAREIALTGYCAREPQGKDQQRNTSVTSPLFEVTKAIMASCASVSRDSLNVLDPEATPPAIPATAPAAPAAAPETPAERPPTSPVPPATQFVDDGELEALLAPTRSEFGRLEVRILGIVSFFDGPDKARLLGLLSEMGVDRARAENACDRLTLAGLISEIGGHVLPVAKRPGELAAALVESEVIALMHRRM